MNRLIIRHARQIVQICTNREPMICDPKLLQNVSVLECNDVIKGYSIVVDSNGNVADVGSDDVIGEKYKDQTFEKDIDATGKCVLPGFIDGHTHPVWTGDRVHEFAMKLSGATYMDIHKTGGGIGFTVQNVHQSSEEELYQSFVQRLNCMIKCGTTTVEAKSGYGLDAPNEIKMLRVIHRAKKELKETIDISCTYCGAHSIPKGKTMEEATDDVINNQIPQISELVKNGELSVDNIDVFCEKGVFDTDATRRILEAGKAHNMAINFHGDELHPMQSGELGAELGARAISHLEEVSDKGIVAMSDKKVVAVLLPTTAYILRLQPPPARKMIDQGVPVALGSDFNPNAFCYSMPTVMHLACCLLRMSMTEALIGATLNSAYSVGLSETHGSIEVGKVGDLVIVDAPRWEHIIYQFAAHDQTIDYVIKRGIVSYHKRS